MFVLIKGPLNLYYGCRNADIDFLYKSEILSMQSQGILKDVKMAYSRDKSMPKVAMLFQIVYQQNCDQTEGWPAAPSHPSNVNITHYSSWIALMLSHITLVSK